MRLGSHLFNAGSADEKTAKGNMMRNSDKGPLVALSDIPAAIGLLTRLPVRVDTDRATARGAAAAWAYPIVGLIVGGIAAIGMIIAGAIGLPASAVALIGVATVTIITGAMHEDGLADTADGLWGGWDPVHRLKIMKDTYIGTYGVIAIVLSLVMRWLLLTELVDLGAGTALIAAAMLSRAAMVGVMAWLPNARESGLSRAVGRPTLAVTLIAVAIAAVGAIGFIGLLGVFAAAAVFVTAAGCGAIAKTKIGGQTGDILGFVQQMTEISVLLYLIATLAG
ncbi:MAG: adenosylcobinamide-GDP ribazoletransferase [Yoonia sp.]|jgi:adenosylcobinamide-GDP ribazoletransferase